MGRAPKTEHRRLTFYQLRSLDPRHKRRTYAGSSPTPHHRLRQHNGEISGGAANTRVGRPYGHLLYVRGFQTTSDMLSFEASVHALKRSYCLRYRAQHNPKILPCIIKTMHIMAMPKWRDAGLYIKWKDESYRPAQTTCGCENRPPTPARVAKRKRSTYSTRKAKRSRH